MYYQIVDRICDTCGESKPKTIEHYAYHNKSKTSYKKTCILCLSVIPPSAVRANRRAKKLLRQTTPTAKPSVETDAKACHSCQEVKELVDYGSYLNTKLQRTVYYRDCKQCYIKKNFKREVPDGYRLQLLQAQDFRCPICGKEATKGANNGFVLDHWHGCCPSGMNNCGGTCLRGMLCGPCNMTLGRVETNYGAASVEQQMYLRIWQSIIRLRKAGL